MTLLELLQRDQAEDVIELRGEEIAGFVALTHEVFSGPDVSRFTGAVLLRGQRTAGGGRDWIAFQGNDGRCFDPNCATSLGACDAVWLVDESGTAHPFHRACADAPWPMSEIDGPATPVAFRQ